MKKLLLFAISVVLFFSAMGNAQTERLMYIAKVASLDSVKIKAMVDSLQYMDADTFDCKAELYWRIIAQKKAAIPYLIDKLSDSTPTKIRMHCKEFGTLNVGQVAFLALEEIADWPVFIITKFQSDMFMGNCSEFDMTILNGSYIQEYQQLLKDWYPKNKAKFKPHKKPLKTLSFCAELYGADTYYEWTE